MNDCPDTKFPGGLSALDLADKEGERNQGMAGEREEKEKGRDYYSHWRYDNLASMSALLLPLLRQCH